MKFNFLITAIVAFIPFLIGLVWFSPRVFGKTWMKACKITSQDLKGRNMLLLFVKVYALSFLMSFFMNTIVIHQFGFFSSIMSEPSWDQAGSDAYEFSQQYMAKYGTNFRTFKHGILHGVMTAFFLAFPSMGIVAMYERRGFKFLLVTVSYWVVSLGLIGGFLCEFA